MVLTQLKTYSNNMKSYTICTIGGDGIGPEVTEESIRLLTATGLPINFISAEAGFGAYQKYGISLPPDTIDKAQKSDAILFGAVTTPPNIANYFSPIVRLRKELNLYANVRPFKSLPLTSQKQGIDFVIVRENTEGLYSGKEHLTEDGAVAERVLTRVGCERIVTFAFELAQKQNRKKVTLVHKANVLRITDGMFLEIGRSVAKKYPAILMDDMLVDSCAMQLIKKTESFDVIVTTNMFGDILSDEAAALTGGLGVASSANMGNKCGLFEPVHGSAPKYAGKNSANPLASFLSVCLMLEFLGEVIVAKKIKSAIYTCLKNGKTTSDLGGTLNMSEFTNTVIQALC
jgi:isopropylmalate/isohomocitrate dehydrogenase-like protein